MPIRCGSHLVLAAASMALLSISGPASAAADAAPAPLPRTADGHPDLSGLWIHPNMGSNGKAFGIPQPPANQADAHTAWTVREGNMNYLEVDAEFMLKADQDMPAYKPEYWSQVHDLEEFAYRRPADPQYGCHNPGVARLSAPDEIVQLKNKVILIYNGEHIWLREIPTDNRPLPKEDDYEGLKIVGASSGHWEGDTLVITTVDFPSDQVWYGIRGWIASPDAKLTERIHPSGGDLEYDLTVDDPKFVHPWVVNPVIMRPNRQPKALLQQPLPCVEHDAAFLPPSK